ncbi:MAG: hypothetical protein ABJA10_07545 [Aestuariivirga sp.]
MKSLAWAIDILLRSSSLRCAILAQLDLPAGTERMWNGVGILNWNGNSFNGLGKMGRIQGAGETAEIRTTETTYELSGVLDLTAVNEFISNPVRNGLARAWLAFLDENELVIPDPILLDETILDTATLKYGADGTANLVLRGTSAIFNFRLPRGRYISNEQLQADFPGDTGFDRISALANRAVSWTPT